MRYQDTTTPAPEQPLVTSSISHRDTQENIEIFPRSVRVRRPGQVKEGHQIPDRSGTTLQGFSSKSRRNLRFAAVNAFPALISQLGLTYHNEWPTDGRESKRHLDIFLKHVRRNYPWILYLWIMEFQKRNAPHYHIFFTVPPDPGIHADLAAAWCRITSPDDDQALQFHLHQKNWIPWDMGNANYLAKYLDKDAQKSIPDGYSNFGRFWGCSRDLVPAPVTVPIDSLSALDQVDQDTGEIVEGEKLIIRWLGRLAEKQTNGLSRFRSRASYGSYTILNGAAGYKQIERFLSHEKQK